MAVMKINKEDFTAWVAETTVMYASTGVRGRSNLVKHLRFYVKLGGGYRVDLGNKVIYDGDSFDDAMTMFNFNAEGAK